MQTLEQMGVPVWAHGVYLVKPADGVVIQYQGHVFPAGCYDYRFNNDAEAVNQILAACAARKHIGIFGQQSRRGKTTLAIGAMLESWQKDLRGSRPGEIRRDEQGHDVSAIVPTQLPPDRYQFIRADYMAHRLDKAGIRFDEEFKYLTTRQCLCLDELGRNISGARKELTEMVIGALVDNRAQIIFTTPLSTSEFQAMFDGSIVTRLRSGTIVELAPGKPYGEAQI